MNIRIESDAKEYISRKSATPSIFIDVRERAGKPCVGNCGIPSHYPSVGVGEPRNMHNYERLETDGVVIYCHTSLANFFSQVTVKIEKLWFLKKLVATDK